MRKKENNSESIEVSIIEISQDEFQNSLENEKNTEGEIIVKNAIHDKLLTQLSSEIKNYKVYKVFSNICNNKGLIDLCKYYVKRSDEELTHHNILYELCNQLSVNITYEPDEIEDYSKYSITNLLEETIILEEQTTKGLNELYKYYFENNMFHITSYLQSLLKEQVEEEDVSKTALDIFNCTDDVLIASKCILDLL